MKKYLIGVKILFLNNLLYNIYFVLILYIIINKDYKFESFLIFKKNCLKEYKIK